MTLASRRCSIASTTSLASRCLIIGQTKGPSSCVGKHPTVFTRSQTTHWALVVDLWPLTTMWKIGKQPTPTHPPPRVPTVLVTKTRRDGLSDRAVHLRGGGGWRLKTYELKRVLTSCGPHMNRLDAALRNSLLKCYQNFRPSSYYFCGLITFLHGG